MARMRGRTGTLGNAWSLGAAEATTITRLTVKELAALATKRRVAAKKGAKTRKARKALADEQDRLYQVAENARQQSRARRRAALGSSPLEGQLGQMDPLAPETLLGQTLIDPARLAQLERDSRELEGRREEERVDRLERLAKTRETSAHAEHRGFDIIDGCADCAPKLERLRGRVERETLAGEEVAARDRRLALEQVERAKEAAKERAWREPEKLGIMARVAAAEWFWQDEKASVDALQEEHGLKGCLTPGAKADRIAAGYGMGAEKRAELRTRMEEAERLAEAGPGPFSRPLPWVFRNDYQVGVGGMGKGGASGGEMPSNPVNLEGLKRSNMFDQAQTSAPQPTPTLSSVTALAQLEKGLEELHGELGALEMRLEPILRSTWREEDEKRSVPDLLIAEGTSELIRALLARFQRVQAATARVYRLYEALQL